MDPDSLPPPPGRRVRGPSSSTVAETAPSSSQGESSNPAGHAGSGTRFMETMKAQMAKRKSMSQSDRLSGEPVTPTSTSNASVASPAGDGEHHRDRMQKLIRRSMLLGEIKKRDNQSYREKELDDLEQHVTESAASKVVSDRDRKLEEKERELREWKEKHAETERQKMELAAETEKVKSVIKKDEEMQKRLEAIEALQKKRMQSSSSTERGVGYAPSSSSSSEAPDMYKAMASPSFSQKSKKRRESLFKDSHTLFPDTNAEQKNSTNGVSSLVEEVVEETEDEHGGDDSESEHEAKHMPVVVDKVEQPKPKRKAPVPAAAVADGKKKFKKEKKKGGRHQDDEGGPRYEEKVGERDNHDVAHSESDDHHHHHDMPALPPPPPPPEDDEEGEGEALGIDHSDAGDVSDANFEQDMEAEDFSEEEEEEFYEHALQFYSARLHRYLESHNKSMENSSGDALGVDDDDQGGGDHVGKSRGKSPGRHHPKSPRNRQAAALLRGELDRLRKDKQAASPAPLAPDSKDLTAPPMVVNDLEVSSRATARGETAPIIEREDKAEELQNLPYRKNATTEETLFDSRGLEASTTSMLHKGIFDSQVKPFVQELFEKYARLDSRVDAKGIQAMCYAHAVFIPLDVVNKSIANTIRHPEGNSDDEEEGPDSRLLDYMHFQIWYRTHPEFTINMRRVAEAVAEERRVRRNAAAVVFHRYDSAITGSIGKMTVRQFRECHREMIIAHVISHHRRVKKDIKVVDRGNTGYVIFKDFIEWVEEIHPKFPLLDARNVFSSSHQKGKDAEKISKKNFAMEDGDYAGKDGQYRLWLRRKQQKVLARDGEYEDTLPKAIGDVDYSDTDSDAVSDDSDDMSLLQDMDLTEDHLQRQQQSWFPRMFGGSNNDPNAPSRPLTQAEMRLREKYRRSRYRNKVRKEIRKKEVRQKRQKRLDKAYAAGANPDDISSSDSELTESSDTSGLSEAGARRGILGGNRAREERRWEKIKVAEKLRVMKKEKARRRHKRAKLREERKKENKGAAEALSTVSDDSSSEISSALTDISEPGIFSRLFTSDGKRRADIIQKRNDAERAKRKQARKDAVKGKRKRAKQREKDRAERARRRRAGQEVETETESEDSSVVSDSTPEPGFFQRRKLSKAEETRRDEKARKKANRTERRREKAARKKERARKRNERVKRRAAGELVGTDTESEKSSVVSDSTPEPGFIKKAFATTAAEREKAESAKRKEARKDKAKAKAIRKKDREKQRANRDRRRKLGEIVLTETESSEASSVLSEETPPPGIFGPRTLGDTEKRIKEEQRKRKEIRKQRGRDKAKRKKERAQARDQRALRRNAGLEVETETESDDSSVLSDSTPPESFMVQLLTSRRKQADMAELQRKKEEKKKKAKDKATRKKQRAKAREQRIRRREVGDIVQTEDDYESSEMSSDSADEKPAGFFTRLGEVRAHARKKAAAKEKKKQEKIEAKQRAQRKDKREQTRAERFARRMAGETVNSDTDESTGSSVLTEDSKNKQRGIMTKFFESRQKAALRRERQEERRVKREKAQRKEERERVRKQREEAKKAREDFEAGRMPMSPAALDITSSEISSNEETDQRRERDIKKGMFSRFFEGRRMAQEKAREKETQKAIKQKYKRKVARQREREKRRQKEIQSQFGDHAVNLDMDDGDESGMLQQDEDEGGIRDTNTLGSSMVSDLSDEEDHDISSKLKRNFRDQIEENDKKSGRSKKSKKGTRRSDEDDDIEDLDLDEPRPSLAMPSRSAPAPKKGKKSKKRGKGSDDDDGDNDDDKEGPRPSLERPSRKVPVPPGDSAQSPIAAKKSYFVNLSDSDSENDDTVDPSTTSRKKKDKKAAEKAKKDKKKKQKQQKQMKAGQWSDDEDDDNNMLSKSQRTDTSVITLSASSSDLSDEEAPGIFSRLMRHRQKQKKKYQKREEKRLLREKLQRKEERAKIREARFKHDQVRGDSSGSDVSSELSDVDTGPGLLSSIMGGPTAHLQRRRREIEKKTEKAKRKKKEKEKRKKLRERAREERARRRRAGETVDTESSSEESSDLTEDEQPGFLTIMMRNRVEERRKAEEKRIIAKNKQKKKDKAKRKRVRAKARAEREKRREDGESVTTMTSSSEDSSDLSDITSGPGFFTRLLKGDAEARRKAAKRQKRNERKKKRKEKAKRKKIRAKARKDRIKRRASGQIVLTDTEDEDSESSSDMTESTAATPGFFTRVVRGDPEARAKAEQKRKKADKKRRLKEKAKRKKKREKARMERAKRRSSGQVVLTDSESEDSSDLSTDDDKTPHWTTRMLRGDPGAKRREEEKKKKAEKKKKRKEKAKRKKKRDKARAKRAKRRASGETVATVSSSEESSDISTDEEAKRGVFARLIGANAQAREKAEKKRKKVEKKKKLKEKAKRKKKRAKERENRAQRRASGQLVLTDTSESDLSSDLSSDEGAGGIIGALTGRNAAARQKAEEKKKKAAVKQKKKEKARRKKKREHARQQRAERRASGQIVLSDTESEDSSELSDATQQPGLLTRMISGDPKERARREKQQKKAATKKKKQKKREKARRKKVRDVARKQRAQRRASGEVVLTDTESDSSLSSGEYDSLQPGVFSGLFRGGAYNTAAKQKERMLKKETDRRRREREKKRQMKQKKKIRRHEQRRKEQADRARRRAEGEIVMTETEDESDVMSSTTESSDPEHPGVFHRMTLSKAEYEHKARIAREKEYRAEARELKRKRKQRMKNSYGGSNKNKSAIRSTSPLAGSFNPGTSSSRSPRSKSPSGSRSKSPGGSRSRDRSRSPGGGGGGAARWVDPEPMMLSSSNNSVGSNGQVKITKALPVERERHAAEAEKRKKKLAAKMRSQSPGSMEERSGVTRGERGRSPSPFYGNMGSPAAGGGGMAQSTGRVAMKSDSGNVYSLEARDGPGGIRYNESPRRATTFPGGPEITVSRQQPGTGTRSRDPSPSPMAQRFDNLMNSGSKVSRSNMDTYLASSGDRKKQMQMNLMAQRDHEHELSRLPPPPSMHDDHQDHGSNLPPPPMHDHEDERMMTPSSVRTDELLSQYSYYDSSPGTPYSQQQEPSSPSSPIHERTMLSKKDMPYDLVDVVIGDLDEKKLKGFQDKKKKDKKKMRKMDL